MAQTNYMKNAIYKYMYKSLYTKDKMYSWKETEKEDLNSEQNRCKCETTYKKKELKIKSRKMIQEKRNKTNKQTYNKMTINTPD